MIRSKCWGTLCLLSSSPKQDYFLLNTADPSRFSAWVLLETLEPYSILLCCSTDLVALFFWATGNEVFILFQTTAAFYFLRCVNYKCSLINSRYYLEPKYKIEDMNVSAYIFLILLRALLICLIAFSSLLVLKCVNNCYIHIYKSFQFQIEIWNINISLLPSGNETVDLECSKHFHSACFRNTFVICTDCNPAYMVSSAM